MQDYKNVLKNFTVESLPSLGTVVHGSLEMLAEEEIPEVNIHEFRRPLVVGSGNAEATGRIMFDKVDAVFASESTVDDKLAAVEAIDEVVLISASGGKHAPIIAKKARDAGKHVTLITSTPNSPTQLALNPEELTTHVFPKNREPYTYNTSTYMAMIQGVLHEDTRAIQRFIDETISTMVLPEFSQYDKYYLIVPPEFSGIIRMLQIKFIELFGRNVAHDIETSEYVRHATTVVPSNELFITFGEPNTTWGAPQQRLNIPLPEGADYISMMAIGYYIIGLIQDAQPSYFKDNIVAYCQGISTTFGEDIRPIVDGTV